MSTYRVGLSRIFKLDINARNEIEAKRLAEFFLGFHDTSNESDREKFEFEITGIGMMDNEAFEVELLE